MGYRKNRLRLPHFYRYLPRVFDFQRQIGQLNDSRIAPDVPCESLFEALFLCLLLRLGSFRALEFEITHGPAKKVWRHRTPCAINTLRHGVEHVETECLDEMLRSTCRKMKRSKMLSDTIGGLHVAAIDGTEYYRSASIACADGMEVHLPNGTVESVHRAVLLQHGGGKLKPFLAAEPILPKDPHPTEKEAGHEGELTAAKRLIDKAMKAYGKRLVDVLTADALYMNPPLVRHCLAHGLDLVARVKDERTDWYQEIQALSALVKPITDYDRQAGGAYRIYEIPDFTPSPWGGESTDARSHREPREGVNLSLDGDIPLRGFQIIETDAKGTHTFLCATTNHHREADGIRRMVHKKWGIENNGNKDLKDNWHVEHNFHHPDVATWAILLTLLLVYNYFYAFVCRHVKTYRIYHLTIQQVMDEFKVSSFSLIYRLPWARWVTIP